MHTACLPPLAPSVSRVCPAAVAAALAGHHLRDATIYFNPRTPYGVRQKAYNSAIRFSSKKAPAEAGAYLWFIITLAIFCCLGKIYVSDHTI